MFNIIPHVVVRWKQTKKKIYMSTFLSFNTWETEKMTNEEILDKMKENATAMEK